MILRDGILPVFMGWDSHPTGDGNFLPRSKREWEFPSEEQMGMGISHPLPSSGWDSPIPKMGRDRDEDL